MNHFLALWSNSTVKKDQYSILYCCALTSVTVGCRWLRGMNLKSAAARGANFGLRAGSRFESRPSARRVFPPASQPSNLDFYHHGRFFAS